MLYLKATVNGNHVAVIERYMSYGGVPWVKVVSGDLILQNLTREQLTYMAGQYPESYITYKPMSFLDIIQLPVEHITFELSSRFFDDWYIFPEDLAHQYDEAAIQEQSRICVKYIKNHCYDGRRTWELGYIEFDHKPFVVFSGAGRVGRDSYMNDIVNKQVYDECLALSLIHI